jgi:DNA-binding LytR/AlgR family response regulator
LSNGNGYSNGNGHSSGNGADVRESAGLSVHEVVELIRRRVAEPTVSLDHIYTKVGNKLRKVPLDDILYIEVEGKYSALQVRDRKYNVKASLKELLQKLPTDRFVRVSRNFVVNLSRIQHIDTFQYTVKVEEMEIPISRTYKEELMRHINLI